MSHDLVPLPPHSLQRVGLDAIPALFAAAGEKGAHRFIQFFTAEIRNKNTRRAYARAVTRFADWCDTRGLRLEDLTPVHVATYVEQLGTQPQERRKHLGTKPQELRKKPLSKPSVKQELAAIRMLFDYLVTGQVVPANPASSVRGPKYVIKKGKTPVLTRDEARALFDAIDQTTDEEGRKVEKKPDQLTIAELRDRALIGVMVYTFARIGAVLGMNVEDYYQQGKRWWIRLHEKGGKHHELPAHHNAEAYLDAYLAAAQIAGRKDTPLFRTLDRHRNLTDRRLSAREALAMVKRRARAAGLGETLCNHTFRATGITVYLEGGGSVEKAQQIAAHESPRTTKLYDRTSDQLTLDEIEKIQI